MSFEHEPKQPQNTPELIAGRIEGGPDDGKIFVEAGTDTVAAGTEGVLDGLPKVEAWMHEDTYDEALGVGPEHGRVGSHDIMMSMVSKLSRKSELSAAEASFVSNLADLGSRTITYLIDHKASLPTTENYMRHAKDYSKNAAAIFSARGELTEDLRASLEQMPHSGRSTVNVMTRYTGIAPRVQEPGLRGRIEDCAMAVSPMLDEIFAHNPDIRVDEYLESNLNHIAQSFERVKQEQLNNPQ